jgi:hypothetical protein
MVFVDIRFFFIRDSKREKFGSTKSLNSTQSSKISGAGTIFFYEIIYIIYFIATRVGTTIAKTFRQLRSASPAPSTSVPSHQK